ncbi:hypothetical protein PLANTIT3_61537 [Plantibacter sp. T3]|nr:hypothetical protein PLANTIT3_61537 [Plantibacter sp. T3]
MSFLAGHHRQRCISKSPDGCDRVKWRWHAVQLEKQICRAPAGTRERDNAQGANGRPALRSESAYGCRRLNGLVESILEVSHETTLWGSADIVLLDRGQRCACQNHCLVSGTDLVGLNLAHPGEWQFQFDLISLIGLLHNGGELWTDHSRHRTTCAKFRRGDNEARHLTANPLDHRFSVTAMADSCNGCGDPRRRQLR